MAHNPSDPLVKKDRVKEVADEQAVGGHFEGESERERRVGRDAMVVVDIFKRNMGPDAGTYFLRVSLRSQNRPNIITRHEIDLDRYSRESEFLREVEWGGGAIAERQVEVYGDRWDPAYVAKQAREAAYELLHEING